MDAGDGTFYPAHKTFYKKDRTMDAGDGTFYPAHKTFYKKDRSKRSILPI
jgi:hypothetical protein